MKKIMPFLLFFLIFPLIRTHSYAQKRKDTKTKQLIVTFRSKPKASDLIKLSQNKRKSKMKFSIINSKSIVYEAVSGDIKGAGDELKTDPNIESVVEDKKLDLLYLPNDLTLRSTPVPGKPVLQWDMFNLNLAGTGRTAWDISRGSSQVIVAVLDSGIDSIHEDLAPKLVSLVDCGTGVCRTVSSMTADPGNLDDSHGTHVAGIIGASTDNNIGMAGSGFDTSLMPIKIRNANGEMLVSAFVNGVRFASDQGVDIINMSLGSLAANLDGPIIAEINNAVSYAWSKNVLLVAAAGNCGWDTSHHQSTGDPCDIYDTNGNFLRHAVNEKYYPGASPNVISVAALDINNNLAPYSEYNDAISGNWIGVSAPGGMFSSNANKEYGISSSWPASKYYYNMGTSAAAPHVAGIAALILAKKPTLTNIQLKSIIEQTGNKTIIPGKTNFGMIDAVVALDSLIISLPVSLTPTRIPSPTIGFLTPTGIPTRTPTQGVGTPTIGAGTPTSLPTITRSPSVTPLTSITPAVCSNNPNFPSCFFAWIYEYTRTILTKFTDFNNDAKIDLIDFEIWRRTNL